MAPGLAVVDVEHRLVEVGARPQEAPHVQLWIAHGEDGGWTGGVRAPGSRYAGTGRLVTAKALDRVEHGAVGHVRHRGHGDGPQIADRRLADRGEAAKAITLEQRERAVDHAKHIHAAIPRRVEEPGEPRGGLELEGRGGSWNACPPIPGAKLTRAPPCRT